MGCLHPTPPSGLRELFRGSREIVRAKVSSRYNRIGAHMNSETVVRTGLSQMGEGEAVTRRFFQWVLLGIITKLKGRPHTPRR